MRLFALAAVVGFSLAGYAAAQPLQFESFDRSGLPARAQTAEERELMRRISAHKRGDAVDAADIQRRLAAYYGARGDDRRARAAERRASAAMTFDRNPAGIGIVVPVQPAAPAEAGTPAYGLLPTPPAAEEKAPPTLAIPVYVPDAAQAPEKPRTTGNPAPAAQPAAPAVGTAPVEPNPATAAQPAALAGEYLAMVGGVVHRWEFRPDGTFEHAWTVGGSDSAAANFEGGAFVVAGGYVTLNILRSSGRAGGAAVIAPSIRRLIFAPPRPEAGGAILLGGMVLKPKTP